MTQLYDISYDDWEDSHRWVLKGPKMTDEEWETLWEETRKQAIEEVGAQYTVVFENLLLGTIVDLLANKGFERIHAEHNKHFTLSGGASEAELLRDVPPKWLPKHVMKRRTEC